MEEIEAFGGNMNKTKPIIYEVTKGNLIVIGKTGTGRSFTDIAIAGTEKRKLLSNNYRRQKHLPMIRKGAKSYRFRKFYLKHS